MNIKRHLRAINRIFAKLFWLSTAKQYHHFASHIQIWSGRKIGPIRGRKVLPSQDRKNFDEWLSGGIVFNFIAAQIN